MKTLYKVFGKGLESPYQYMKYKLNKEYHCDNFDNNSDRECSNGFYAVDMDGLLYCWKNYRDVYKVKV